MSPMSANDLAYFAKILKALESESTPNDSLHSFSYPNPAAKISAYIGKLLILTINPLFSGIVLKREYFICNFVYFSRSIPYELGHLELVPKIESRRRLILILSPDVFFLLLSEVISVSFTSLMSLLSAFLLPVELSPPSVKTTEQIP